MLPLDNYNITLKRYHFSETLSLSQVNFFNSIDALIQETIDVKDYLISIDNIDYDYESAENYSGVNTQYFVTNDVGFKLSGLVNGGHLYDFFKIKENNTDYYKWVFEIIDDNNVSIFKGIIPQENINVPFNTSTESQIFDVRSFSLEKEFKQWYSQTLLDPDLNFSANHFIGNYGTGMPRSIDYMNLLSLLQLIFDNLLFSIELESSLQKWYVAHDAGVYRNIFIGSSILYQSAFIASSYERYANRGKTLLNKFAFLENMCYAMGWVFYFYNNKLTIKNRSTVSTVLPTMNIEFSNFIDYDLSKYQSEISYDNIVLITYQLDSRNATSNSIPHDFIEPRFYAFTGNPISSNPNAYGLGFQYGKWWNVVEVNWSLPYENEGFQFNCFASEDPNNWQYFLVTEHAGNVSGGRIIYTFDKTKTLFLNTGDSGQSWYKYNFVNGQQGAVDYSGNGGMGNDEVFYKGNCGCGLFYWNGNSFNPVFFDYDAYLNSTAFRNNYLKFFNSKLAKKINVTYNGVITNPLQIIKVVNATDTEIFGTNDTWNINKLSVDLVKETTQLELQLIRN